jgi:hypothetical protein
MRTAKEWLSKIEEEKLDFIMFLTLFQRECLYELQASVRKMNDESVAGNVIVMIFRKYGRVWDEIAETGLVLRINDELTGSPAPGAFVKKLKDDFMKMDFGPEKIDKAVRSALSYL